MPSEHDFVTEGVHVVVDSPMRRLRSARNVDAALIVLGLAMLWPLLRAPFMQTVLSVDPVNALDPHVVFDLLVTLMGFALVVFAAYLGGAFRSENMRAPFVLAAAASSLVGVSLLLRYDDLGLYDSPFMLAWSLLLAFGLSVLFVSWSLRIKKMGMGLAASCLTVSFLLSFVFGAFDYSSTALRVLCFVLPLGSSAMLLASFWWHKRCGDALYSDAVAAEGEVSGLGQAGGAPDQSDSEAGSLLWSLRSSTRKGYGMVLCFMLVGLLASAVVRSLWMHDSTTYQMKPTLVPTYVISVALALSYLVVVLASKGKSWGLLLGLAFTMLTLLVGIILCAAFGQEAGLGAIASAHTAFEFLFWSFFTLTASGKLEGVLRGVGVWLVAEGSTSLLATEGMPRILGINADTATDLTSAIGLISMTLIAVSFVGLAMLLMREMGVQLAAAQNAGQENATDVAPVVSGPDSSAALGGEGEAANPVFGEGELEAAGAGEHGRWLIETLVSSYGLTEREAQVAASVSHGNSVKKTAEMLYIAPSTVQGYMKSIYRKMGINRKQSLVDIAAALEEQRRSSHS